MSAIDLEAVHTPHPGSSRDAVSKMNDAAQPQAVATSSPRMPQPVRIHQSNTPPGTAFGYHPTVIVGTGQIAPVQRLLPRDPNRAKATIVAVDQPVWLAISKEAAQAAVGVGAVSSSLVSLIGQNSATDPGAAGVICTCSGLVAGNEYTVQWSVSLEGTVTTGDANNMQLTGAGLSASPTAFYPGVVGTYQQQVITCTPSVASLQVKAIAAASGASAIYAAQIIATPVAATVTGVVSSPGCGYLPAGGSVDISHCEEVWVAPISSNIGRVSAFVSMVEVNSSHA